MTPDNGKGNEYRFSNLGLSGRVLLTDDSVHWYCRYYWHGKYEREIPLSKLQDSYLKTVGPPNHLGALVGITTFGLLVAIGLLADRAANVPSAVVAGLIATAAIFALTLYLSYRDEEWIWFFGSNSNSYICFCRRGPDSVNFESFTEAVKEAIRNKSNEQ